MPTRPPRRTAAWLVTMILPLAAACGGDGRPTGAPAEVAGSWSGAWTSGRGPSGAFAAALGQDGSSLDGSLSLSGSPCLTVGVVHGTASGRDVVLTAEAGGLSITMEGTLVGDQMSGTYRAYGGACDGDVGSFTASR